MRLRSKIALATILAAALLGGQANAQGLRDVPRLFGEVLTIQAIAVGPLVFEDADTAQINELEAQIFGIQAPNINEACTTTLENRATCGLLALTFTLDVIEGIDPLDCLIIGAEANNTLIIKCLSTEFKDNLDFSTESRDLGEILVLGGYARADDDFEGPEAGRYKVAELAAKRDGRGFWDCEGPTPRSWSSDKNRLC